MKRKKIIIAMAVLALLTAQCKREPKPTQKVMVPINGSVDFGGGSKTQITIDGYVTPVQGDKIYIYNGGTNVGYMTCTPTTGQEFDCSGEIDENYLDSECTFMYLGSNNGVDGESTTISFADQTSVSVVVGKIANLDKFHVGSCTANVTRTETGEGAVDYLHMVSKMAIAYFQLKDEGDQPVANQTVNVSGISAVANIDKANGTISGDGTGSIAVRTDADGKFYMALVPQSGAVTVSFAGDGNVGEKRFPNGIRECSFYSEQGSGNPLQVTVTKPKPKFTVGDGTTVEFAPGNLYYNGEDDDHKMNSNLPSGWNFYEHQWNCYPSGTSSVTESMEISLLTWGYGTWSKVYNTTTYQTGLGVTMTDWGSLAIGSDPAGTWRTLTIAEWRYLLGIGTSCRDNASDLRAWKDFGDNVKGLVILPDGTDASVMSSITSKEALATSGAVFLPAAGYRYRTGVHDVGSYGNYWSSTPNERYESDAYGVGFGSGEGGTGSGDRDCGNAVRLVR